jgi:integral membrane protein
MAGNQQPSTRLLKAVSLAESGTLAALVFIAVPLKHLAHIDFAMRVLGPIHGLTFLLYLWVLMQAVSAGGWRGNEIGRMIVVAMIPLAGFFNQPWLGKKLSALNARELPL